MRPLIVLLLASGTALACAVEATPSLADSSPSGSAGFLSGHGDVSWQLSAADTDSASTQVAGTFQVAVPSIAADTAQHVPTVSTDPAVLRACERIRPGTLVRVNGSFGSFRGNADVVGPEGFASLRPDPHGQKKGTSVTPPPRISWDQVDRVEIRGGSALRGALAGGVATGAFGALLGMAAVAVSSTTSATVGEGAALGFVYLAPVGVVIGGLSGAAIRRWVPVYKRSAHAPPAAAPTPAPAPPAAAATSSTAPAKPKESAAGALWYSPQVVLSQPTGSFQPPNPERSLGFTATLVYEPTQLPVEPRFEFGRSVHGSSVNGVKVDNPNGIWVDEVTAQTGSTLTWGMLGAQWSPLKHGNRLYVYAMGGFESISPMEKLGGGYPVIEGDVPGLPPSENGFAWSAGVGSRLRVPGFDHFALVGEFDYRRLGAATYVTAPGVQGDYPNSHYVVTSGPVETWNVRFGFAFERKQR